LNLPALLRFLAPGAPKFGLSPSENRTFPVFRRVSLENKKINDFNCLRVFS